MEKPVLLIRFNVSAQSHACTRTLIYFILFWMPNLNLYQHSHNNNVHVQDLSIDLPESVGAMI